MSSFFVPSEVYKKRIDICKSCVYYFKPTGSCKICGCFMKLKARISQQYCPEEKWLAISKIEASQDIPEELIQEVFDLWPYIKTGRATNKDTKRQLVELYNTIYGGHYNLDTSCGSCLNSCFIAIESLYNENKNKVLKKIFEDNKMNTKNTQLIKKNN